MTEPNIWEYKVESLPPGPKEDLEETLKILGEDNWELCEIFRNKYMIFKRQAFSTFV